MLEIIVFFFLSQLKVLLRFHQEAVSKNAVNQAILSSLRLLQGLTQEIDRIQMPLHLIYVSALLYCYILVLFQQYICVGSVLTVSFFVLQMNNCLLV